MERIRKMERQNEDERIYPKIDEYDVNLRDTYVIESLKSCLAACDYRDPHHHYISP